MFATPLIFGPSFVNYGLPVSTRLRLREYVRALGRSRTSTYTPHVRDQGKVEQSSRLTTVPNSDELMAKAAAGDQTAFAGLYDALSPLLYGIILRIVRDPARSEEVTQEVFVELWKVAPTFDSGRGNVRSFAVTVAKRRAIDCVRSVEAARKRDDRDAVLAPQTGQSVEDVVTQSDEASLVRQALAQLPASQQKAIELAYFGSMSYREVAEALGDPVGTVKTRIRDGMKVLRLQLGGVQ